MNPKGLVVWFTGMPASGKTTLARQVWSRVRAVGRASLWLDSDALRAVMTPEPTYQPQERECVYNTLGQIATWAADGGIFVIVSATAPRRSHRDAVRARVGRFVEVFLRCGERERRRRDPKQLYRMADAGKITQLPGVGTPYEPPDNPEIVVDSDRASPRALADTVWSWLAARGDVPRAGVPLTKDAKEERPLAVK